MTQKGVRTPDYWVSVVLILIVLDYWYLTLKTVMTLPSNSSSLNPYCSGLLVFDNFLGLPNTLMVRVVLILIVLDYWYLTFDRPPLPDRKKLSLNPYCSGLLVFDIKEERAKVTIYPVLILIVLDYWYLTNNEKTIVRHDR